jgi:hypothetical protein
MRSSITLDEIHELVCASETLMSSTEQRLWNLARIHPAKWRQEPWANAGDGVWVVGILGRQVIWYNDIECGFNISHYVSYGTIEQYFCNQDELHYVISALCRQIETGIEPGKFGLPAPPLSGNPSAQN